MKKTLLKLGLFIPLLLFMACGCEKDNDEPINDDEPIKSIEGYIVGFDPCTINNHYRIGYVIMSTDSNDILLTYNLSDSIYKMPASVMCNISDTLYQIPEYYFQYYRSSGYFPEAVRYEFKVKATYTKAIGNELVYDIMCPADINISEFNDAIQVIIKSATKY